MNPMPRNERSLLNHPLEAALAIALLVSLLLISPERKTMNETRSLCNPAVTANCAP